MKFDRRKKPVFASGIPVFCKHDAIVPAESLKPHPDNAHREHPPKQLDAYELVIAGRDRKKGNGWRKSVVVSLLSGCITKGHGAWLMAKRRGWSVPIEYQRYRSRAEERRDLLADNKLPAMSITDNDKLAKLLAGMSSDDVELTGFNAGELERLLRDSIDIAEAEFPITAKLNERYDFVVVFTENESDFAFLQTLCGVQTERSYKKTGIGIGRAVPFARFLKSLRE